MYGRGMFGALRAECRPRWIWGDDGELAILISDFCVVHPPAWSRAESAEPGLAFPKGSGGR